MSIYQAEKGAQRVTLDEWKSKNEQSITTTDYVLSRSVFERKDSALLRSETKIKSKWDTYDNEDLLAERISLVQEWLRNLQHSLQATEKEKLVLIEVKTYLEAYLNEALLPPLDVVAQCLYLRDKRHPLELTIDPVSAHLNQELHIYEVHKSRLAALDADAWRMNTQLSTLIDVIKFCISEQSSALDVDVNMLSLKITSPGLALRPEPQRVPTQSSAPDSWLSHCSELVERQKKECAQSRTIRENMLKAIEEARNSNRAQQEDTSKSYRERIHEIKIAIGRLKRQREQILEEMEKVDQEIQKLEVADQSLDLPRALCETRHEGRTTRPAGPQRCQDDPQDGLAEESNTLAESQRTLQQNTIQARAAYEALRIHLAKVEFDLEDKNAALALELRCLSSRELLEKSDFQVVQSHSSQL